jgi:hypothetical protein
MDIFAGVEGGEVFGGSSSGSLRRELGFRWVVLRGRYSRGRASWGHVVCGSKVAGDPYAMGLHGVAEAAGACTEIGCRTGEDGSGREQATCSRNRSPCAGTF